MPSHSAFNSAGQRCSALRVLLLQDDIADRVIELLRGYMQTLVVGDPALLETDVGPVIDEEARRSLEAHVDGITRAARWVHRTAVSAGSGRARPFRCAHAVEIESLDVLSARCSARCCMCCVTHRRTWIAPSMP